MADLNGSIPKVDEEDGKREAVACPNDLTLSTAVLASSEAQDDSNDAANGAAAEPGTATATAKKPRKKYPKKARKAVKKKPDDMPRRPLSAVRQRCSFLL